MKREIKKRWSKEQLLDRHKYLWTKVGADSMHNGFVARELCKAYRMVIKDFDNLLNAPKT